MCRSLTVVWVSQKGTQDQLKIPVMLHRLPCAQGSFIDLAVLVVQTSYSNVGFDKTFSLGWRLSQLPPPARRPADVTLKTPCLTQWTVVEGAPVGKGHSRLCPLMQQMGLKPGLLSAEEQPFH